MAEQHPTPELPPERREHECFVALDIPVATEWAMTDPSRVLTQADAEVLQAAVAALVLADGTVGVESRPDRYYPQFTRTFLTYTPPPPVAERLERSMLAAGQGLADVTLTGRQLEVLRVVTNKLFIGLRVDDSIIKLPMPERLCDVGLHDRRVELQGELGRTVDVVNSLAYCLGELEKQSEEAAGKLEPLDLVHFITRFLNDITLAASEPIGLGFLLPEIMQIVLDRIIANPIYQECVAQAKKQQVADEQVNIFLKS